MSKPTFRDIPSVSAVLESAEIQSISNQYSVKEITSAIRTILDHVRQLLAQDQTVDLHLKSIVNSVVSELHSQSTSHLRPVINATGIVLHTNLGRSCLAEKAVQAAASAGSHYLNLELDLETGKRSHRIDSIRDVLVRLTGAESGTAVNNCAAATMLVLKTLAAGKEVIISRGQLIEIGGNFRIPEIMTASGAILEEVGTTNITRIADYERAIGPNTALIIRIHPSNYRIHGFTETPSIADLVDLGKKYQIPVVDDVGSGLCIDLTPYGLPAEPTVADGIKAGADLVLFSGDKLLGGPQAGIIAGRKELIQRLESDPFMRAIRLDKLSLAALQATLKLYQNPKQAVQNIPTLRMLTTPVAELQARAEILAEKLRAIPHLQIEIQNDQTFAGGGSLPDHPIDTVVIALSRDQMDEQELATRLRIVSILARIKKGKVILDLRTIEPTQFEDIKKEIEKATY